MNDEEFEKHAQYLIAGSVCGAANAAIVRHARELRRVLALVPANHGWECFQNGRSPDHPEPCTCWVSGRRRVLGRDGGEG